MNPPIIPTPTPRTALYWSSAGNGRFVAQRCSVCATVHLPNLPACPGCGSPDSDPIELSGNGAVHASSVVRWPAHPAVADWLPYVVALIDLDGGPRAVGRILGQTERVAAGSLVRAVFLPAGEDLGVIAFELEA